MNTILCFGILAFGAAAWLIYMLSPEKGGPLQARLWGMSLGFVVLLGIWGVFKYGIAVFHWFGR